VNTESRSYYQRFYRLIAIAVAVMTAVLTGSLMLGDSVRGSLMARVNERLGNAETLIQTGTGFLNDSILGHSLLATSHGYLLAEGFISSNGQMIPVTVWGTADDSLQEGEALLNEPLKKETGTGTVVLHLPSNNLVGSGSLFISQSYATQLRLTVKGTKSGKDGGNILLHNEQVRPFNIFINRKQLGEALGVTGKLNVVLSPERFSPSDFQRIWRPEYSGTQIHDNIVSTDRVFLPQHVVDSLKPSARYLAYFVNSLGSIPYSFVTATDQLHGDETILSDYAAQRMNAHVGDSITLDYYVSQGGLKQLKTRSHRFIISQIVPLTQLMEQSELITADFPGLSGVKHCTDWDSDLPIDMSRITRADEDYWDEYRQSPKALVSLDAVGHDWIGAYGAATKIQVSSPSSFHNLTPESFGIAVVQPREAALHAAQNGTDFGMLFLALGFFIIISAILLMQNPLSEMYHLRRSEIQLYGMLGFSRGNVFRRLFTEALPIVLIASPIGVLLGLGYAALILWLLSGPWSGATQTDGFTLHVSPITTVVAFAASVLVAVVVLALAIKAVFRLQKPQKPQPKASSLLRASLHYYRHQHRLSFWTLALGVLVVFAVGLNRPDFSHTSEKATGGYTVFGESRIPIQYDINTSAGRHHLHLDNLSTNARFLQLPKHTEDEASCLNLNKVETPSVLGMTDAGMKDFGIDVDLMALKETGLIPLAIDEEALIWSMMRQVGDTLTYHSSDGRSVKAIIATTYPTGILHGNAIIPMEAFRQLWPDETGSRILLMDGADPKELTTLSDYGLTVTTTIDRLLRFFEVTDTYLSIFLSLGGLGLLLGLASLLIVVRKNLAARREEIRLYQTLGFPTEKIVSQLRREQLIVPLLAILTGALGSLVSISANVGGAGRTTWITAIVLFLLILFFTWIIIYKSINNKTIQQ